MDLKKQILVALGLDKQDEVALEYQAKLEDGTLIVSTSTNLEAGVDISVLTEDGSRIKNLEDAIADLKKDKVGNDEVEESDVEMESDTEPTPKKVKTTEEIEFEYQAKIEELKSKVVELSNQPADTPVDTNKFSTNKKDFTPDLRKMTKRERILYNLTNN